MGALCDPVAIATSETQTELGAIDEVMSSGSETSDVSTQTDDDWAYRGIGKYSHGQGYHIWVGPEGEIWTRKGGRI